jgi:hypothetical protein
VRFYNISHKYYCGIDLHTKMMYVCILNEDGEIVLHQNIPTQPHRFLKLIAPYREDIVVGVECIYSATAPALLYLLHPCSRLGTGWRISARRRALPSFWDTRSI